LCVIFQNQNDLWVLQDTLGIVSAHFLTDNNKKNVSKLVPKRKPWFDMILLCWHVRDMFWRLCYSVSKVGRSKSKNCWEIWDTAENTVKEHEIKEREKSLELCTWILLQQHVQQSKSDVAVLSQEVAFLQNRVAHIDKKTMEKLRQRIQQANSYYWPQSYAYNTPSCVDTNRDLWQAQLPIKKSYCCTIN
jgi:hypothetical protein